MNDMPRQKLEETLKLFEQFKEGHIPRSAQFNEHQEAIRQLYAYTTALEERLCLLEDWFRSLATPTELQPESVAFTPDPIPYFSGFPDGNQLPQLQIICTAKFPDGRLLDVSQIATIEPVTTDQCVRLLKSEALGTLEATPRHAGTAIFRVGYNQQFKETSLTVIEIRLTDCRFKALYLANHADGIATLVADGNNPISTSYTLNARANSPTICFAGRLAQRDDTACRQKVSQTLLTRWEGINNLHGIVFAVKAGKTPDSCRVTIVKEAPSPSKILNYTLEASRRTDCFNPILIPWDGPVSEMYLDGPWAVGYAEITTR